jgi:hypothetical protein
LSSNTNQPLDQLDESKRQFSGRASRTISLLKRLARQNFRSAESLIRFHETLLFLRAYPQSAQVVRLCEAILSSLPERIEALENQQIDISPFEHPDVSGIAGTSVTDTFSYNIVRWLLSRHPSQLAIDWDWFEDENRLASTWPRFIPLLEEDAYVEANVPYREWLRFARNGKTEVRWLVEQFERLPRNDNERAELYDSLKLYVRWTPSYKATRTGMRLKGGKHFYHRKPLIQRRDVDLRIELETATPALKRLPGAQGKKILDLARETSTVRYRELYGFTHGDEQRVFRSHLGRGVDLFVVGLLPERRLPLRAYHAAIIFKNGVPVGYFEGLSLFERMESGFNFYYNFREGETAWIYARTLQVFRHLLNVTAFSIDPYQIGFENEEGIESGAFWFYRKLGFRPTDRALLRLTENEERKIQAKRLYRTSARVLRKLAGGPMIFELEKSTSGDWDQFSLRRIGFESQRRMASRYQGNATAIRSSAMESAASTLGLPLRNLNELQMKVLSDFSLVLEGIEDLNKWSKSEKENLVQVILAKAGKDEARYLKLMQQHRRLRKATITLGSQSS